MSYPKNLFTHPYTNFLTDSLHLIRDDFYTLAYSSAAHKLLWLIPFLDTSIKRKLKDERETLWFIELNPQATDKTVLYGILNKIMSQLHKAGYFSGAKIREIYVGSEKLKTPLQKTEI